MKKWVKWNKESAMIVILAGILCLVVVWPSGGEKTSGVPLQGRDFTASDSPEALSRRGRAEPLY